MTMLTPDQWAALSTDERRRIMAQTAYERTQQSQEDKKPPSTGQSTALALAPAAGYLGVRGIASGIGALSGGEAGTAGASGAAGAGTAGAAPVAAGAEAAGAGTAATGTGAAGSGTGFLSSAGAALPWLGVAGLGAATGAAAYDAYNKGQGQGWKGGLEQGVRSAGWMNAVPVLGQAAWLGGMIGGGFGGKKHKDQYKRDYGRRNLKDAGLINDKYELELMDGQTFNIGKEDPWSDAEKSPYGGQRQYDLDVTKLDDPAVSAALQPVIGGANAIATLAGNDQMAGYLINGATRTKDPYAQTRAWVDKMGGYDAAIATLGQMDLPKEKIIEAQTGLNMLYGKQGYDKPKWTAPMPGAKPSQKPEEKKPEQKAATGRIAKLFAAAGK